MPRDPLLLEPEDGEATWARESASRAEANRERQEAAQRETERRVAEADRKAFEDRVDAEVERRLRAMGKA
jgi:hypothetical protein